MVAITLSFKGCKTHVQSFSNEGQTIDVPLLCTVFCWGFDVRMLSCKMCSVLVCLVASLEVFLQQSVSWYVVVKLVRKKCGVSILCSFIYLALTGMFPRFPKCNAEVF
jgi:hypothetical protein